MRTIEEIYEAIDISNLPVWRLDLVYVHYNDKLDDESVETILRGEWPDHHDDWISDSRFEASCDLADELFRDEASDTEFEALEEEWEASGEREDLIVQLQEMDTSDPYGQLAGNTGPMLFRVTPSEDDMAYLGEELTTAVDTCEALGLDPIMEDAVAEILPEIEGYRAEGGAYFGATWVFSAHPGDLLWLNCGTVTVSDPFLWITNPYRGNGYGVVAKGATVELKLSDIHVDSKAWGYGANDVFGGLLLVESDITPKENS